MKSREFKDIMYEGLSKLLKALSSPARLEIIEMLSQGEKSVEGIVEATGLTVANASQHLQVLKNNNIVKSRKQGHYVYYSLLNLEFLALYQQISRYAVGEIAELGKVLSRQREDNLSSNAVSLEDLDVMIREKNIVLLDVRPNDEFLMGHITGAVSVPVVELDARMIDLPKRKEIIAYCRGPFCVLADEAVRKLREKGYRVRRLDEGYPEWKIKSLESERS